jgi:hypothetical protein
MNLEQLEDIFRPYKELLQTLVESFSHPFDKNLYGNLPSEGGIYRIFEKGADWQDSVYIGKSFDLQKRIYKNHFMGDRKASSLKRKLIKIAEFADEKAVKQYLKEKCLVQFVLIRDKAERTWFEHFSIAVLKPRIND